MSQVETNTRKILDRLAAEEWVSEEGAKHVKLSHPGRPGIKIMVPRHREVTYGVARVIAKAAGWI